MIGETQGIFVCLRRRQCPHYRNLKGNFAVVCHNFYGLNECKDRKKFWNDQIFAHRNFKGASTFLHQTSSFLLLPSSFRHHTSFSNIPRPLQPYFWFKVQGSRFKVQPPLSCILPPQGEENRSACRSYIKVSADHQRSKGLSPVQSSKFKVQKSKGEGQRLKAEGPVQGSRFKVQGSKFQVLSLQSLNWPKAVELWTVAEPRWTGP